MNVRRLVLLVLLTPIILVLLLIGGKAAQTYLQRKEIEGLIGRYTSAPDEETAGRLADILDRGTVSPDLGNRILSALLSPEIHVRDTYPVNKQLGFTMTVPFEVRFADLIVAGSREVCAGDDCSTVSGGGLNFNTPRNPLVIEFPGVPRETGVYSIRITVNQALRPLEPRPRTSWLSWVPFVSESRGGASPRSRPTARVPLKDLPAAYAFRWERTVDLRIVEEENAGKISMRSNAELDQAMRESLVSEGDPFKTDRTYRAPSGWMICYGGMKIAYSNLPENFTFRVIYRDETGFELPYEKFRHVLRKGTTGWFTLTNDCPRFEKAGMYRGVVRLAPDIDTAYKYPDIESVWGGFAELPIEFSVVEKPR